MPSANIILVASIIIALPFAMVASLYTLIVLDRYGWKTTTFRSFISTLIYEIIFTAAIMFLLYYR